MKTKHHPICAQAGDFLWNWGLFPSYIFSREVLHGPKLLGVVACLPWGYLGMVSVWLLLNGRSCRIPAPQCVPPGGQRHLSMACRSLWCLGHTWHKQLWKGCVCVSCCRWVPRDCFEAAQSGSEPC